MRFLKLGLVAMSGIYLYTTGAYATPQGQAAEQIVKTRLVEDIGASERVEAAALLRVLSQEVASAACHMGKGVDPQTSRALLVESKTKFAQILDALQHGNPRMNIIGREERRKTVAKIEDLRAQWTPIHHAAVDLIDDHANAEALLLIKAENEAVLAATFDLTSELAGQYSNPAELLQSDVMLLDFAGRQALLTQKMAKIACEIWSGNRAADRLDLLSSTMQTYDMTLVALHDGMPAVGLIAAPTPEIDQALTQARADWSEIKPSLDGLIAKAGFADADKYNLYNALNTKMRSMEKLEKLYVVHSKHNYD